MSPYNLGYEDETITLDNWIIYKAGESQDAAAKNEGLLVSMSMTPSSCMFVSESIIGQFRGSK